MIVLPKTYKNNLYYKKWSDHVNDKIFTPSLVQIYKWKTLCYNGLHDVYHMYTIVLLPIKMDHCSIHTKLFPILLLYLPSHILLSPTHIQGNLDPLIPSKSQKVRGGGGAISAKSLQFKHKHTLKEWLIWWVHFSAWLTNIKWSHWQWLAISLSQVVRQVLLNNSSLFSLVIINISENTSM